MLKQRSNRGFSLIQMVVATGILGVVVVVGTTFITRSQDSTSRISGYIERDVISKRIRKAISSIDVIRFSANQAGNNDLERCIEEAGTCTITHPDRQVGFWLHTPIGTGNNSIRLAGKSNSGTRVHWSETGGSDCDTSRKDCPAFRADAYFWAECPNNAASCPLANIIYVRFQLVSVGKTAARGIGEFPKNADFANKTAFAIPLPVQKNLVRDSECGVNAEAKGYDAKGNVKCGCSPGFAPNGGTADRPICTRTVNRQCGQRQRLVGIGDDGLPICQNISLSEQCSWVDFGDSGARCPQGGWLRQLNMGKCQTGPATKKDNEREVECERNRGRCCRERF